MVCITKELITQLIMSHFLCNSLNNLICLHRKKKFFEWLEALPRWTTSIIIIIVIIFATSCHLTCHYRVSNNSSRFFFCYHLAQNTNTLSLFSAHNNDWIVPFTYWTKSWKKERLLVSVCSAHSSSRGSACSEFGVRAHKFCSTHTAIHPVKAPC